MEIKNTFADLQQMIMTKNNISMLELVNSLFNGLLKLESLVLLTDETDQVYAIRNFRINAELDFFNHIKKTPETERPALLLKLVEQLAIGKYESSTLSLPRFPLADSVQKEYQSMISLIQRHLAKIDTANYFRMSKGM